MTLRNYDTFFETAFTVPPFSYQREAANAQEIPALINVPTGAGKTAAILGAWLWRRWQNPQSVGRRLVYCLPMRTLVEQTTNEAKKAVGRLVAAGMIDEKRFGVHVLMGGDASDEWDAHPERECIIIGTQDMLLSRALNRGYAMSRYRWAFQFGLLNNDCLWVFDEVQLMSEGLAASTQLQAMREKMETFGACRSLWMSATLDREWLKTIDFREHVPTLEQITLSDEDRRTPVLAKRLHARKDLAPAPANCRMPEGLARFALEHHTTGTQTLVVVNRVARARETFAALENECAKLSPPPELKLIHSRFRPHDRRGWIDSLNDKPDANGVDRIIIATQVVEAGLDISSRLLITDLAPYASLVQRMGRCNRAGEYEEARVFWVDRPLIKKLEKLGGKETLDEKEAIQVARPYEAESLETARTLLPGITSAAPADLERINHHEPYTPAHYPRRRDIVDLFDTTPDLSGNDIDISRWIRGGDERDVFVAWRAGVGDGKTLNSKTARFFRKELCPVPIHEFKEFLDKNRIAFIWDTLGGKKGEGKWRRVKPDEIRVGMMLLMDATVKGYDSIYGWRGNDAPKKQSDVVPIDNKKPEQSDAFGNDPRSFEKHVQTLVAHTNEVYRAAETLLDALTDIALDDATRADMLTAARYHDWGKAHEIFQKTMHKGLPPELCHITDMLAKTKGNPRHERPYFRHELASALALLQIGASDLCVYLAATHHGKVRLSIRAMPGEMKPRNPDAKFARGIHDNDPLPAVSLGDDVMTKPVMLDLEPMLLGSVTPDKRSWLELTINLREQFGVFRLAYLEALIRAADVQASSADKKEVL
ncbi:MAG: type I-G CRISPR-associated helicase/endonuclease Cas3g [Pyrinomonadaceae bacterium]